MKVLLIKMSSLGDVLHTLPALEDAHRIHPLEVTWVIEPSFQEMPLWHRSVKQVIPLPWRTLRKSLHRRAHQKQCHAVIETLRSQTYDLIIDAQGLLKSAVVAKLAKGPKHGFDAKSAREGMAAWFYDKRHTVSWEQHAVLRLRNLFAQIFDYNTQNLSFSYGLKGVDFTSPVMPRRSILLMHGTTWASKQWPLSYWQRLAQIIAKAGFQCLLPWGNEAEYHRAQQIQKAVTASFHPKPILLDKMTLTELAGVLQQVEGVVAVDTGLGHLASALAVPCVSIYGPTDPKRTGTYGLNQIHLKASKECAPCLKRTCTLKGSFEVSPPCFALNPPESVWEALSAQIETTEALSC